MVFAECAAVPWPHAAWAIAIGEMVPPSVLPRQCLPLSISALNATEPGPVVKALNYRSGRKENNNPAGARRLHPPDPFREKPTAPTEHVEETLDIV